MSQINPFAHVVIQSAQVQRQQTLEKERQLGRQQDQAKNIAAHEDVFEHQVESADELNPIHEEGGKKQPGKKPKPKKPRPDSEDEEENRHIDLTA